MRALLVFVLAAGCGRVRFDQRDASDGDAGRDTVPITTRHWKNRNDGTPGRLFSPRMTYDDKRRTVLMYGGGVSTPLQPDAHMWELTSSGWTLLCDPCAPGPLIAHGFAYDAGRDRVVLVDGTNGTMDTSETWEWDGATWSHNLTGTTPPARRAALAIFDEALHEIVLFGGIVGNTANNDTFVYSGAVWSQMTPAGTPPVRTGGYGNGAIYDRGQQRVLALADDCDVPPALTHDDLFEWDGATWMSVCSNCTGVKRTAASLVYDPALQTTWQIGGFTGSAEIAGTWRLVGNSFEMFDTLPPARDSVAVAYDRARDTIVLYGGNGVSCPNDCGETWELVPN